MKSKIISHLSKDKKLKIIICELGLLATRQIEKDLYVALTRSIVGQQLSVKAAATIYERFTNLFKNNKPTPEETLEQSFEMLRSVGLSKQKLGYVQNVASFFLEHKLRTKDWTKEGDEDIIQLLTQIKGVGIWTVQMILMFSLSRPDVFPTNDLGIQQAIKNIYNLEESGKALKNKMLEIAEPWKPYQTSACYYLWSWKDNSPS